MAKYTTEAITAILATIHPIAGRPTFRGLWHLSQAIGECLRKITHPHHPNEGFVGYMMLPAAYALYSRTPWLEPSDVGEYFEIPAIAITEMEQKTEENKWKAKKELRETFENVRTALSLLFERIIDQAYHSGGTGAVGLARRGFGNDEPPDIYARLQRLYGKPTIQELDQALLRLNEPMDRNQPVEVMLKGMEEIQMFLMAHPDGDREMSDVNLISYGSIKLAKCGGLYTKAMERWQAMPGPNKKVWANFRKHYITEYEKLLAEGGGTTLGQEGYGGAFHMADVMDDDTSITESIVKYAERATMAESKVSNLEQRLAQLEVTSQMGAPPPNAAYYAPEAAYYTPQQHNQIPPTINVPPTQQQYGGQPTYQQPTYAPNKRKKRGGSRGGGGQNQMQFGQSPNVYRPQAQQQPQYQGRGGQYTQGRGRGGRGRGSGGRGKDTTHTNVIKRFDNLLYCFTCGYDVDHPGTHCQSTNGNYHIPNVKREEAHMYSHQGACMVAQHKSLTNGEGCGVAWMMANAVTKAQFVMDRQHAIRKQQGNHQQWHGNQQQQQGWGNTQQQQGWDGNNWNHGS